MNPVLRLAPLLACLVAAVVSPAIAVDDADVLVLGRISDDPQRHYGQLKPLLDYVVPRMATVGIRRGRVLMARDTLQMQAYLRGGRVDWVTETAGMAGQLALRAGARALLLTERDGVGAYHSLFIVRRDSGISSLDGLRGHALAFQRRSSTSAYLAPAVALLDAGLVLEPLLAPGERPAPGKVGYLFAQSERNIAAWVQVGLVDAGTLSNTDWENPERVPPAARENLRVMARTVEFPRAVELVRGDLDPLLAARLREVLLGAASDPNAAGALRSFFGTTGFRSVDAATLERLEHLGAGAARMRAELE